jgi:hypothetical protein
MESPPRAACSVSQETGNVSAELGTASSRSWRRQPRAGDYTGHDRPSLSRSNPCSGEKLREPFVCGLYTDCLSSTTVLGEAGVSDRCEVITGDLFQSVPEGGDAYVFSQILHDWDDEPASVILRNCRQAMTKGKKLLIVEQVTLPGDSPDPVNFGDLNMLVLLGGRERTALEFERLLDATGFRLESIIRANPPWSVIEGIAE